MVNRVRQNSGFAPIIFLVLVAALAGLVYFIAQNRTVNYKSGAAGFIRDPMMATPLPQVNPPVDGAVLKISPASQSVLQGSNFKYYVNLNSGAYKITGLQLELRFDPNVIQVTSISKGSGAGALVYPISNKIDNTLGTINYAAIIKPGSGTSLTGTDLQVLIVNAMVKRTAPLTTTTLSFDITTVASASQLGANAVKSLIPGTVTVTSSSGSTKPTPSPNIPPPRY